MKTTTKKMMALAAITSAVLLTGCQKDLYDPDYVASIAARCYLCTWSFPVTEWPSDLKRYI